MHVRDRCAVVATGIVEGKGRETSTVRRAASQLQTEDVAVDERSRLVASAHSGEPLPRMSSLRFGGRNRDSSLNRRGIGIP